MSINSENSPKRIEGQIWIDKNSPNRLKYYVNGHEYIVEVSGSYPVINPGDTEKILYCGTVVKLSNQGYLIEAKFPEDIADIIGVIASTTTIPAGTTTENAPQLAVTKNGWVLLASSRDISPTSTPQLVNELEQIFADFNPLETTNYWSEAFWGDMVPATGSSKPKRDNLIGAPVFWCLDQEKKGKLTLSTPSGFYWKKANTAAASNNVSYYNLPQVGNISKINYKTSDNSIESVEIHINFSKFDASLEWSWPAWGISVRPQVDASNDYTASFKITHGILFPDTFKPQTEHHVTGRLENSAVENEVIAETDENYSSGVCTIKISNPYSMDYRVSGEVNFRLNMSAPVVDTSSTDTTGDNTDTGDTTGTGDNTDTGDTTGDTEPAGTDEP